MLQPQFHADSGRTAGEVHAAVQYARPWPHDLELDCVVSGLYLDPAEDIGPLPAPLLDLERHADPVLARENAPPADGTCGWRGILPGQHRIGVAFEVKEGRWQWADVFRWVEIKPGDNTVEFQVMRPGPGVLDCRVHFASGSPAVGVELWLEHHDAPRWSHLRAAVVAEDGTARFAGLQPGRYRVQSSCSPSAVGTRVDVAAGPCVL